MRKSEDVSRGSAIWACQTWVAWGRRARGKSREEAGAPVTKHANQNKPIDHEKPREEAGARVTLVIAGYCEL